MPDHKIKCEVISVNEEKTKCQKPGDSFTLGGRTPDGMCARAFSVIYPVALAMRVSDSIPWQGGNEHFDVTCPDQHVTYRLSRLQKE